MEIMWIAVPQYDVRRYFDWKQRLDKTWKKDDVVISELDSLNMGQFECKDTSLPQLHLKVLQSNTGSLPLFATSFLPSVTTRQTFTPTIAILSIRKRANFFGRIELPYFLNLRQQLLQLDTITTFHLRDILKSQKNS
jgi:hypothetical protein